MDFWDKLTKKASDTYKGASEKTTKIAKETKLKMKMNDNKSKIEDLYLEIGKKVYQKHVADTELINIKDDIREECEKIDQLGNEIENAEKEIWELKDNKQCPKCKSKINKSDVFCPVCGTRQQDQKVYEVEVKEVEGNNNESSEEKLEEEQPQQEETQQEEHQQEETQQEEVTEERVENGEYENNNGQENDENTNNNEEQENKENTNNNE